MSEDQPKYQLVLTATGEVRNSKGELKSSEPVTMTRIVTEQEMLELLGQSSNSTQ